MRAMLFEYVTTHNQRIQIVQGDITEEPVDAIVNAANERLAHGGGVAGTISRRGGASIQRESDRWVHEHGPVSTGSAAITGAGELPARYVLHAVGPVWGSGDEQQKLRSAVQSALGLADVYDVHSVSMPAISAGIFGFPPELCAEVIIGAVHDFLQANGDASVQEVNVVLYSQAMADVFLEEARRQFSENHQDDHSEADAEGETGS